MLVKLCCLALAASLIGCTTASGADGGPSDAGACVHVGDPCTTNGEPSSQLVCIDGPGGFACERFHDDGGPPWCRLEGDPCVDPLQCCGLDCASGSCQVPSTDAGPGACSRPDDACTEEGAMTAAGGLVLTCVRSSRGLHCERVGPDGGVLCRTAGDTCDVTRTDQCCGSAFCFSGLGPSGVCGTTDAGR